MHIGALMTVVLALFAVMFPGLAYAGGPWPIPPIPSWLCTLIILVLVIIVIYLWRERRRP